ncbi:MAG TPA: heme o synthase [Moraxellaceae bacterium]
MSTLVDDKGVDEKTEAPLWRAYWELTKPGVVALLMVTAVIGMFLATPGMVPLRVLILGSLGLALSMMASAVVNQVMDQRIDAIMARTQKRPLVEGRVNTRAALFFAAVLCVLSLLILDVYINRLTAVLTFFGIVGYAFIYTLWLKRATPQNIVIGGLAGAIPPLLGWTAVTGEVHPHALLLVLIIFAWTPPHFWALAIHRREEYAKADIPMLPVTHGLEFTKTSVLLYTVILLLTAVLPYLTGMSSLIYLLGSSVLGAIFLLYALRLKFQDDPKVPMKTFGYSITYLFLLFLLLLVDHYFPVRFI